MNATAIDTDSTTKQRWVHVDTEGVHSDEAEEAAVEAALDFLCLDDYDWVEPTEIGYDVGHSW